jgi:hypothetical protein
MRNAQIEDQLLNVLSKSHLISKGSLANELTDILLEGDAVDIEINDKNSGSALRALRKLSIDYEIID